MPIGYINVDEAPLYEDAFGDEKLRMLSRGETILIDALAAPVRGRSKVRYDHRHQKGWHQEGWLESRSITRSGLGVVVASRRSGTSIPARTTPATPTGSAPTSPSKEPGPHAGMAAPPRPNPLGQLSDRIERRTERPMFSAAVILATMIWGFLIFPSIWRYGWPAILVSPILIWVLDRLLRLSGKLAELLASYLLKDGFEEPTAAPETGSGPNPDSSTVPRWKRNPNQLQKSHLRRLLNRISGRARPAREDGRARAPRP